jgi:hypothetical protein
VELKRLAEFERKTGMKAFAKKVVFINMARKEKHRFKTKLAPFKQH